MPTKMDEVLAQYNKSLSEPRKVLLGAEADAVVDLHMTGEVVSPSGTGKRPAFGYGSRLPIIATHERTPISDLAKLSQRPAPGEPSQREYTELTSSQYLPYRLGSAVLEKPLFAIANGAARLLNFSRDATMRRWKQGPQAFWWHSAEEVASMAAADKATGWIAKAVEVTSRPERYGIITPQATEFSEAKRALIYQQGLLEGVTDDVVEQGIDIAAYFIQLAAARRLFPTQPPPTKAGAIANHLGFIGTHAIAFTNGPIEDRAQAALWRIAYNVTPFIANATGATGLRATSVDAMLNALLSSPAYIRAFNEQGGLTPEFLAQVLPQLATDVAFALNTRGLPDKIATQQFEAMLKATGRADGMNKAEIKDLLKTYRTIIAEGRGVTLKGDKVTRTKADLPEWLDNFFADRDEAVVQAMVDRINLQNRVIDFTGGRKMGKQERDLMERADLYIDFRNAEERGLGTYKEQLEKWGDVVGDSKETVKGKPTERAITARRILEGEADRLGLTGEDRAEFIDDPPIQALTREQIKIVEDSQRLPPQIRAIAEDIILNNRALRDRAQDAEVIRNGQENWTMRLWKQDSKFERYMSSKFGTFTGRAMPRTLDSIIHGWALGMELRLKGADTSMETAHVEMARVIANRELIKAAQIAGDVSTVKHPDWERIDPPDFRQWIPLGERPSVPQGDAPSSTVKPGMRVIAADRDNIGLILSINETHGTAAVRFTNRLHGTQATVDMPLEMLSKPKGANIVMPNVRITDTGQMLLKAELFAPKDIARKLNNIFGKSALHKIPGITALTKYNAQIRSIVLTSAFFHHQAFARSYWLGGKTSIADVLPTHGYKEGKKALEEFGPELRDLVRSGMTLGLRQDWEEQWLQEKTFVGRVIDRVPGAKQVKDKLLALRETQSQFLFGKLGPYLKTQAALAEYRALVRDRKADIEAGVVTRHELAGQVARLMNADFGGLHLGRMARNPTLQHAFHLTALAPDWTESNVRTMTRAFRSGDEARLYRRFWGRIMLKGIAGVAITNLLISSFDDEDFITRYELAWKKGNLRWLEVDITPLMKAMGDESGRRRYWNALGHFKDPVKFATHPLRSAQHKGSIVTRSVVDMMTGQDWAGRRFTTAQELFGLDEKGKDKWKLTKFDFGGATPVEYMQFPSWATYEIKGWTPIQSQQFLSYIAGEIDGISAIAGSLGIQISGAGRPKESDTILSIEENRRR